MLGVRGNGGLAGEGGGEGRGRGAGCGWGGRGSAVSGGVGEGGIEDREGGRVCECGGGEAEERAGVGVRMRMMMRRSSGEDVYCYILEYFLLCEERRLDYACLGGDQTVGFCAPVAAKVKCLGFLVTVRCYADRRVMGTDLLLPLPTLL